MTLRHRLWAVLTLLLAVTSQSYAQSNVDSRVRKLEETIQRLESRVASLESQLRERPTPAAVPAGKEGWRKLKRGMSEAEVEQLLGSPGKVDESEIFIMWRYGTPALGSVQFDGKTRKVERWSEP